MKHATPIRHITAKTVLLAFVISFAVFGSVLMMAALSKGRIEDDSTETDATLGRVRTAVLFFRKNVDELTGAILLTVDARRMEITARGVSPEEEIDGRSLQNLYKTGSLYAATQLAAQYGTSADGVLSFSVSNVAAFLVYAGERLSLTLPEQVGILPAGESTLTPMQVADVLRYKNWSNGTAGQADIHAAVVAAIFNRYLVKDRDLERDFKKVTELCDERLYISQFEAIKEELYALAEQNNGAIAKTESTQ